MKIKEILIETLLKTQLFEMAFSKRIAIDKARNLQNQIARHIIKILMYGESDSVNHWINEVDGWLLDIQDNLLKNTNKPLSYNDLILILFQEPLSTIPDIQTKMNRIYKGYPDMKIVEPDPAIISKKVSWLLPSVCKDISESNFTSIKEYL